MENASLLEMIEVFAARICHDLVGPVGAIANGVELLAGDSGKADPEVVQLISSSARSASRRLQYFRTAFGSGNALSETRPLADARVLALALMEDGKIRLDWPLPGAEVEAAAGRKAAKLILNVLLVASEALPRGGAIRVALGVDSSALRIEIVAEGLQARLSDELRMALAPDATGGPTARAVPAWLAKLAAGAANGELAVREADASVRFGATLPRSLMLARA